MIHIACDYCGADDAAVIFPVCDTNYGFAGAWEVVRCRRCGLVYLNPRPDEQEIGRYYPDGEYSCFTSLRPAAALGRGHHFIEATQAVGLENGSVCDIGCGVGDFLSAARASGWQIAGIEPNPHALRICRTRLPDAPVFGALAEAAFPDASFDAITMWHVFEHLPSPGTTLDQIRRLLRVGGILGLAVPNFGSLERRLWGRRWIGIQAPTHFYHFELTTLRRYLEDRGFSVLGVMQAPGANSLAANILRTLRNLLLDPFASHSHQDAPTSDSGSKEPSEHVRTIPGYVVSSSSKEQGLRAVTRAVYPLAWAIARLGYGPELLVYARKPRVERYVG